MRVEPRNRRQSLTRGVLLTDVRSRPVAKVYGARAVFKREAQ